MLHLFVYFYYPNASLMQRFGMTSYSLVCNQLIFLFRTGRGYFLNSKLFSRISNWDFVRYYITLLSWFNMLHPYIFSLLIYSRVVSFDIPDASIENHPFEQRYSQLNDFVPADHPFLISIYFYILALITLSHSKQTKLFIDGCIDTCSKGYCDQS